MPKNSAKLKTGKTTANNLALSDDLEFDLPKAQRLDNAYAEYLHPNNIKSERTLSLEHGIARSTLKGRIQRGSGERESIGLHTWKRRL